MVIEFLGPTAPTENGGIAYRALVDGETVACKFSQEALQDVNPAYATLSAAEQFTLSQAELLEVAKRKIKDGCVVHGVVNIWKTDL